MQNRRSPRNSAPRRLGQAGGLIAVLVGLTAIYSCSLILETHPQCSSDADCAMFAGAKCEISRNICVSGSGGAGSSSSSTSSSSSSGADGSAACTGDGGCFEVSSACVPSTDPDFLNACTDSTCIPFDDTRITTLLDGGGLPDLPPLDSGQ